MFDPQSSRLLQGAPTIPDVAPEDLPRLLTEIYTELVTNRVRGIDNNKPTETTQRLTNIGNTYEMLAILSPELAAREASAFVAATAYQILAKSEIDNSENAEVAFSRDYISGHIASALLFLIAAQYADAREAIRSFTPSRGDQPILIQLLSETLVDLVLENYNSILQRADRRSQITYKGNLLERANLHLYALILQGVEVLAAAILGQASPHSSDFGTLRPDTYFNRVINLSTRQVDLGRLPNLLSTYPGPAHLATLLNGLTPTLLKSSIVALLPPDNTDRNLWSNWLSFRAQRKPLLWSNHLQAVNQNFHHLGKSVVMILPTGAGKTTLSEFKIAATLASGKKVIFLAPTNALVEQLQHDLSESIPASVFGDERLFDEDLYITVDSTLPRLEVMTPEKCLALLNFSPDAFIDIGLLVFDECHSLSAEASVSIRRALDGMLVVLNLLKVNPEIDFLFLSAMLREPQPFADWISEQTGKRCLLIDLIWKPSRQARGVVIYSHDELVAAEEMATRIQTEKDDKRMDDNKVLSKTVQSDAVQHLRLTPYALFGLVHNWHPDRTQDISIRKLTNNSYKLSGKFGSHRSVIASPSGVEIARNLAVAAANTGLKTIVFVNNANWTHSSAQRTEDLLTVTVNYNEHETRLLEAIATEFGRIECSMLYQAKKAVPHNADLIVSERHLTESLFRRDDGAIIIYATTTLSQGMNLPAQVAILSADERANLDGPAVTQLPMKQHELLNAAGRAGRAGYLANGLVILVPRTILTFAADLPNDNAKNVLKSIIPEDERCVPMIDPLQRTIDEIQSGVISVDSKYLFNKLNEQNGTAGVDQLFNTSFARFIAVRQKTLVDYNEKVATFKATMAGEIVENDSPEWLAQLSVNSGISLSILNELYLSLINEFHQLPRDVTNWMQWILSWLALHEEAGRYCFGQDFGTLQKIAAFKSITIDNYENAMAVLASGMNAWLSGKTMIRIEQVMERLPNDAKLLCPKAREIATNLAPRSLSYFSTFIINITKQISEQRNETIPYLAALECLPSAIKKGVDSPQKLVYYNRIKNQYLSRVGVHQQFELTFPNLIFGEEYDFQMIIDAMSNI
ncbi:MAG: DEAD/DEAH box helicase [Bacteroidota bacterium]